LRSCTAAERLPGVWLGMKGESRAQQRAGRDKLARVTAMSRHVRLRTAMLGGMLLARGLLELSPLQRGRGDVCEMEASLPGV